MKALILILLVSPALWGQPVQLYFQDVETYYGGYHALGGFYDDGPGGSYGIHSVGGYRDPYVLGGDLNFPLHGPGVLYVPSGFHNSLTFQYTAYLPFYPDPHAYLVLRYQGNVTQQVLLPTTRLYVYDTYTVAVNGAADEIWFGIKSDGTFIGNAGDVKYKMIGLDLVEHQQQPAPQVTQMRAAPQTRTARRTVAQPTSATRGGSNRVR